MPRTSKEIIDLYRSNPGDLTPTELNWIERKLEKQRVEKHKETQKSYARPFLILAKLSEKTGQSESALSRFSKRADFPKHVINGRKRYLFDEVESWLQKNVDRRAKKTESVEANGISIAKAHLANDDPLLMAMRSGTATPVQMLEVAAKMSGMEIADAYQSRSVPTTKFDALKKTLEELRKARVAQIELEKSEAELITRSQVRAIISEVLSRCLRMMATLVNVTALESLLWRDPKMAALPSDEYTRAVRAFLEKTTADVRRMEAEGVEKLIDAQTKGDS